MKIIYIGYKDKNGNKTDGIIKKIRGQAKALSQLGIETELCQMEIGGYSRLIPFNTLSINWKNIIVGDDIDGLYIRYQKSDFQFIRFLRIVKKNNPKIKIAIEIPTYPYDRELMTFRYILFSLRDHIYRNFVKKYTDRIFYMGNCGIDKIFGVQAIRISNGIDIEDVKKRTPIKKQQSVLNICTVANFAFWHGIDRFIYGMTEYYRNGGMSQIVFHIVGDGHSDTMQNLRELASNEYVRDKIIFEGYLTGDDLDVIYNKCDMAVACLGCHRKNLLNVSDLKSREYLAKGIPFCYSSKIDVLEDSPVDFALELPSDDTPINIQMVVDFYYNLLKSENVDELTDRIRAYGERCVNMKVAMKPVADYFLNNI